MVEGLGDAARRARPRDDLGQETVDVADAMGAMRCKNQT